MWHGRGFLALHRLEFPHKFDGIIPPLRGMQESKQMTRRNCIWLALALGACRQRTPLPSLLPETVANVWRRTSLRELSVSDAPDPVPRSSIRRLEIAGYEGPGKLEARVYEMSSQGVAFDLVQRWRPSADTVFFNQGEFLVVVKWEQADRQALRDFVRELESRLPK